MTQPLKGLGTPPAVAPSNLTISRLSGTTLKLMWDPSVDYYHRVYRVYRSDDNFATETIVKTTAINEFTDRDLPIDTWYYRIIDVDKFDIESDVSSISSYEIKELVPFKDTFDIPTAGVPVVKDIEDALGRKAVEGTIICLGSGKIQVEFSADGTNYDTPMWLRQEDYYNISSKRDHIKVSKIRFDTDVNGTEVTISVI